VRKDVAPGTALPIGGLPADKPLSGEHDHRPKVVGKMQRTC